MMSAFDCFQKAEELAKAAEASSNSDYVKLRAMAMYWTILGQHVKTRETGQPRPLNNPLLTDSRA